MALVVILVELNPQTFVGAAETVVHPTIHLFPQFTHMRIARFPQEEHLLGAFHQGGVFLRFFFRHSCGLEFVDFLFVCLVELHIVFAHQFVAFHAGTFGRFTAAEKLPCKHRLAYVYAPVVDYLRLVHFLT